MSGRGLASFAAGFGTGMLSSMKAKKDQARQDKIDAANEEDRQARRDELAYQHQKDVTADAQNAAYTEGMANANTMQKGTLIDQSGAKAGLTTGDWAQRVDANTAQDTPRSNSFDTAPQAVLSDDQKTAIANTYAQDSKQTGAEKWLSSDAPDAVVGNVHPTSQADIYTAKASASAQLGIRGMPQADAYTEKATTAHIKDLQIKVLDPSTTGEDISKLYEKLPDGKKISFETNPNTNKLMAYTTDDNGAHRLVGGQEGFPDLNAFKQYTATLLGDNPDAVMALMDKHNASQAKSAETAYTHGQDEIKNKLARDKFNQDATQNVAANGIAREKIAAEKANKDGANSTATLKFINDTSDNVSQRVAEILDANGRAKFTMGKTKFATTSLDPLTGESIMSKPKYNTGAKLNQHARTLIAAGVPEADAVSLLSDRKTIGGKDQYASFGSAKVMIDGKEVTKKGMIYKGQLIPLD